MFESLELSNSFQFRTCEAYTNVSMNTQICRIHLRVDMDTNIDFLCNKSNDVGESDLNILDRCNGDMVERSDSAKKRYLIIFINSYNIFKIFE
jgi:hypothetical protein